MTAVSDETGRGLEPCPFCGGINIKDRHVRDGRQVYCVDCGASVAPTFHGPAGDTIQRATAAWNKRAALSAAPVGEPALRMCGYCKTWNSKPCGEQCYLQPSDPVWTAPVETWKCAARKQSLPEPADCGWPTCGCDPHADKVIAALEEQGHAAPVAQEPVAYQYRACIAGKWGDWTDLHQSVEGFRNGPWKFGLENGTCELRALYAGTPPATPAGLEEDWRDDPSADERWQAGLDYGMERFCSMLGVDPKDVRWDAATEELDGDVCAVIGNVLRVKFGDDFDPMKPLPAAGVGADEIARVFVRWKKSKNLHESLAAQNIEKELLALLSRAGDQK